MNLGLLDLLAPQFLIDFRLPNEIHDIVSVLRVKELKSTWDETCVVHTGIAALEGDAEASATPIQKKPTGEVFEWGDVKVEFRLTIPRAGSQDLKNVVDVAAGIAGASSGTKAMKTTLDALGVPAAAPAPGTPTPPATSDYPGFAFRLELLLSTLTLHLPKSTFVPARLNAAGWLERDPDIDSVRIVLPKIAIVLNRDNKPFDADLDFEGWGATGLDDPLDREAGELISMQPPLCLHESGVFGFGMEKAVLDLSADNTPPEVLELMGTGQDFRGLWLPHVRIFVAPKQAKGLAFDAFAKDLLIDFRHGVSGEFGLEVVNRVESKMRVQARFYEGTHLVLPTTGHLVASGPNSTIVRGSRASLKVDGELQLAISGGLGPFDVVVKIGTDAADQVVQAASFSKSRRSWPLGQMNLKPGVYMMSINVVGTAGAKDPDDKNADPPPKAVWDETIELELRKEVAGTLTTLPFPTSDPTKAEGDAGYRLELSPSQPDAESVLLLASPPMSSIDAELVDFAANADTPPLKLDCNVAGEIRVPMMPGRAGKVTATWPVPAAQADDRLRIDFAYDVPSESQVAAETARIKAVHGAALAGFIARAGQNPITVTGQASYEGDPSREEYNEALSTRRAQVLAAIVTEMGGTLKSVDGEGFADARAAYEGTAGGAYSAAAFERADAVYEVGDSGGLFKPRRSVDVSRAPLEETPIFTPSERAPTPEEPARPSFFRRIGVRTRIERNRLSLFEIAGEVDVQTAAEDGAKTIKDHADKDPVDEQAGTGLTVKSQPGASAEPNAGDGIVDYRFTATYDTATRKLTEVLSFGAGETDRDGLLHIDNSKSVTTPPTYGAIGNVAGALLVFAPLLAKSIDSAVTAQGGSAVVPMVMTGLEVAGAAALGLTGAMQTQKITWYGAELTAQQTLGTNKTSFDSAALLFDYGVDFSVNIDLAGLKVTSKPDTPLRVRYRAIGPKLDFGDDKPFSMVFDTSRGYQLDLADPGLFQISSPFGDLLKILGARVAKNNPTVIDLDLGLKVNLGVVTVDRLRVTWPLDPMGPPTIVPTGVSVNIPGVLTGSGSLDIHPGGFKGGLDLTLVPLKLRIAGGLGIDTFKVPGRNITAVIVTLKVEFPSAIPVGSSGMGLFGLLGLFAMHYRRKEVATAEAPALEWLNSVNGDPTDINGWEAAVDRWSFGVGAVLGTLEGGTLISLKGMLVLELPGPRVLIFVRMKILIPKKPDTRGTEEEAGLTAVVDLDFGLKKLTIGVLVGYKVDSLIDLSLQSHAHFDLVKGRDWGLDIGSISQPGSALILNMVRASGYLMFAGDVIENFPGPDGPIDLPGFAIALGLRAALLLGKEKSNLFLKLSASLDVGLSFSPFHVVGVLELIGELKVFVISLSCKARLTVDAPKPTIVDGLITAKVEFLFFNFDVAVHVHYESGEKEAIEPPPLVLGMGLQSRSPALIAGQGADRPIDGKLGDAQPVDHHDPQLDPAADGQLEDVRKKNPDFKFLVVPIDSVPILKLHAAPTGPNAIPQPFVGGPFDMNPLQPPRLSSAEGRMEQGGGREVSYVAEEIIIEPPLTLKEGAARPPATWRAASDQAQGEDTAVDLALFSWEPVSDARAAERSAELTDRVGQRWLGACNPVAAPVAVVWTFSGQPLGSASDGWRLKGHLLAQDPPDTRRSSRPRTRLRVKGPIFDPLQAAAGVQSHVGNLAPATVVGFDDRAGGDPQAAQHPGRVLQLPFRHIVEPAPLPVPKLRSEQPEQSGATVIDPIDPSPERVVIHSGPFQEAVLLVALHHDLSSERALLRAFDAEGRQIGPDTKMFDLPHLLIREVSHLPDAWRKPGTPIAKELLEVMDFFGHIGEFRGGSYAGPQDLSLYTFNYTSPDAEHVHSFEIVLKDRPVQDRRPVALLGAVQVLSRSEIVRVEFDEGARSAEIKTIESALTPGLPRPLLEPDTRYTVTVKYRAETWQDGKRVGEGTSRKQAFTFVTDKAPPARIDPWVLVTTPSPDEGAHFVDDPVRIVFNDRSVVQLYEAYGQKLLVKVRQSNGNHPKDLTPITDQPPKPNPEGPNEPPVKGEILTPFEETLRHLLETSKQLLCVNVPATEAHHLVSVKAQLERSTAYTFDVEPDDLPPYPKYSDDPTAPPRRPLLRVAFTTSRFRSRAELADVMRAGKVRHRVLSEAQDLASLGETPTDVELEDALVKAGLEAMPPSTDPCLTLLWLPQGGDEVLLAALIDAPEPLWRFRPEPFLETEEGEAGSLKRWTTKPREWLGIVEPVKGEATAPAVKRFIRAPGGARTLLLLNGDATRLELSFRQREHSVIDPDKSDDSVMFAADLPQVAPWRIES